MAQGGASQHGQIVGVDVVGEHVVVGTQGRHAPAQPFKRQALGGVDPGRAQNADAHAVTLAKAAQLALGVDAALGARGDRAQRTRFVDALAGAVAINTAGTDVDQPPRSLLAAPQGREQPPRARVYRTVLGRRGKMQNDVGQPSQALQTLGTVQIG